jgi:hypothetical protein
MTGVTIRPLSLMPHVFAVVTTHGFDSYETLLHLPIFRQPRWHTELGGFVAIAFA